MQPKYVQPDYDRWRTIQVGTTRAEVTAALGDPLKDRWHVPSPTYSLYGYLELPGCPHRRTYNFMVGFDEIDRVFTKQDPFNGEFSVDGRPTRPQLIIPCAGQVFSHYPRVLDIRWFPVSGVYPITYELAVGFFPCPTVEGAPPGLTYHDEVRDEEIAGPYTAVMFGGTQPGRVRVRARNELGAGEWSEYRYFRFTV